MDDKQIKDIKFLWDHVHSFAAAESAVTVDLWAAWLERWALAPWFGEKEAVAEAERLHAEDQE